jgi:hypothetical protein
VMELESRLNLWVSRGKAAKGCDLFNLKQLVNLRMWHPRYQYRLYYIMTGRQSQRESNLTSTVIPTMHRNHSVHNK